MKLIFILLSLISVNAWSQDPVAYLNAFDAKVYSLKTKGVKDFVVDIQSSKLTKQLNDQMIFGNVKEVIFRTYWTSNPERLAVEVMGLPEGFKEAKEELKLSIMSVMDSLIPMTNVQRLSGYKFSPGTKPKEFIAKDSTGIAGVQSFLLKFDGQDRLIEVEGNKPIGTLVIKPQYEKDSFSDGKWVLKSQSTTSSENGQTLTVKKDLIYGKSQGIAVLESVKNSTEQSSSAPGSKPLILEDTVEFKNYKINTGEAMSYFLGDSSKSAP